MGMFMTDEPNFLYFMAGLTSYPYYSADYWPLFPWIFAFISGAFGGKMITLGKAPEILKWNKIPPLSFIGRHTLIIYIVHQPILLGILTLCLK
ncbi:MAG: heparan-alpha-glucosaminide N-acetyltransferase domain-containing protein, partial [Oscillospiraceae bacterium]